MIVGIVIAKLATSTPSTPTAAPAPSVTELQTMGVNAFAARQWDTALRAFEQLADQTARDGGVLWLAGASPDTQALVARSGSTLRVMPAEAEPGLSVRRCLEVAGGG